MPVVFADCRAHSGFSVLALLWFPDQGGCSKTISAASALFAFMAGVWGKHVCVFCLQQLVFSIRCSAMQFDMVKCNRLGIRAGFFQIVRVSRGIKCAADPVYCFESRNSSCTFRN